MARVSILIQQLAQTVSERGVRASTLASAMDVPLSMMEDWLAGRSEPSISQYERLMALLRLVPVFTSVDAGTRHNVSLRDYVSDDDAEIFDQLTDNPIDILRTQLRDLQLQRIRIEQLYESAALDFEEYMKAIATISDLVRYTVDSISKVDISAKMSEADDVEQCYGSPRGPAYKKEDIDKIKAKEAKDKEEAAKCQPTEKTS